MLKYIVYTKCFCVNEAEKVKVQKQQIIYPYK